MPHDLHRQRITLGTVARIGFGIGISASALLSLLSPAHAAAGELASGVVSLPPAAIAASGIRTAALQPTRQSSTVQATASVLDPEPLLALAVQLQAAHADAAAAAVNAAAAGAEARRSAALYHGAEDASLQQVQATAASAARARAQQLVDDARDVAARMAARARWGEPLAALAARGPQALKHYMDGQTALLSVVLPADSAATPGDTIQLALPAQGTLDARLIGPSPRTDAVVQGASYYYRADGSGLRVDQRLTATVPLGSAARSGVTVPAAAVIWYAGQPWVYVETAAGRFQRRPLAQDARNPDGWFATDGFRAGERVVVRGGELLLSQELLPPPGLKPATGDGDDG